MAKYYHGKLLLSSGLAVQVNNDLKKKITCPPTITLGDLLLDINAGDHVALLEGAVVKNNTFIHTLFEKTSIDCCLHVVSEVCELIGSL